MAKKIKKKAKVMVAMSGGVDSSVAAKLLKDQEYDVVGVFLHFWKDSKGAQAAENKCCSVEAFMDARRVCQKIGIPLYTMNFSREFKKNVVDNFIDEYRSGNTPNPCVRCNKRVKLGLLIKKAKELGFDYVASGHYARLKREIPNSPLRLRSGASKFQIPKYKLFRAKDKNKDQSYFLYTFSQDELSHLLFPLGEYTKDEVRSMAKRFRLPVAEKKESQEICFIPEKNHNDFLKRHIKMRPGKIKTIKGETVGEHKGLPLYTIGQRKGIEIGGTGPFYAVKMDYKTNTLYVAESANDKALFKNKLIAENVTWISDKEPLSGSICEAVIRYRHNPIKCVIHKKGKKYEVRFKESVRAITPGQSVVFYKKEEVLGGGVINN